MMREEEQKGESEMAAAPVVVDRSLTRYQLWINCTSQLGNNGTPALLWWRRQTMLPHSLPPPPHHTPHNVCSQQRVVWVLETMELPTALMRFKYRIKPPFVLSRLHFAFFLLFRAKCCLCLCYCVEQWRMCITKFTQTKNGSLLFCNYKIISKLL